jgi:ArsR family transcriptional regulator
MRQTAYLFECISQFVYIERMEKTTSVFSALSDPIRLRSLALIVRHGELCVCELVAALDLPQPKVSRHLAVMREAGLLRDRRDAQWVLYALSPDLPTWVVPVIEAAVAAVEKETVYGKDAKRLARAERPARSRCGAVA